MAPGLDAGLLWVENQIREISQVLGKLVDCTEWPRQMDARAGSMMAMRIIPLKLWRGGESRIVRFQRKELLEVEGDPEVQQRLEERIKEVLHGR